MATTSHRESTFMTFLIVRILLIITLWTILWSFTLVFVPHTMSLKDPLAIVTLSSFDIFVALSIAACSSLVLAHFSSTLTLMVLGVLILQTFKSLFAYCVFLGSSLIASKTKKQTVVSRSSAEAELRAFACVTAEVTWLRWLLTDFGVALSSMPMHCDSTGATNIAYQTCWSRLLLCSV
jgi:hypothetical protein